MGSSATILAASTARRLNVADRLAIWAGAVPDAIAIACPTQHSHSRYRRERRRSGAAYAVTTFAELDDDATRIARGLAAWGVPQGTRLALLVRPGIEFVTLVFALLRAGMVIVLVDPGLGRRNMIRCLTDAEPKGFVGIGAAQFARLVYRHRFPNARWNVTVGRRWFWGGKTLEQMRSVEGGEQSDSRNRQTEIRNSQFADTRADDPAAIIFTSGSTGIAKGVLYTQRMFDTQVAEIQAMYGIESGGVDLACFPLFGLFNAAMGVTTVLPEMDFSRPASADPRKLIAAANDWQVTQAFASPAVWRVVSDHGAKTGERIPTLRQVFSCGAPVPANVLRATLACVGQGARMHTPYGATECLPVSTIEAAEVLNETAARTDAGAGVCVGRKFESIDWRVIRITDEPIATMDDVEELPAGEIGELVVRGPQVSPRYVTRGECNWEAKIGSRTRRAGSDGFIGVEDVPACGDAFVETELWHRTGDVGYLDAEHRFWYCGRKTQRVETVDGPLYTECVEAIATACSGVKRCALVGVGARGRQVPVLVVERQTGGQQANFEQRVLQFVQRHPSLQAIQRVLVHEGLPVDVRHNAKINREQLAAWAARRLPELG